ncbi:hypothetical protein Ntsu_54870 [Nocardia sp. IFM 10818]
MYFRIYRREYGNADNGTIGQRSTSGRGRSPDSVFGLQDPGACVNMFCSAQPCHRGTVKQGRKEELQKAIRMLVANGPIATEDLIAQLATRGFRRVDVGDLFMLCHPT